MQEYQGVSQDQVTERQAVVEKARGEWVGCRVHCVGTVVEGYAEVVAIDGKGFVALQFENPPYGYPGRVAMQFEALGSIIFHAE